MGQALAKQILDDLERIKLEEARRKLEEARRSAQPEAATNPTQEIARSPQETQEERAQPPTRLRQQLTAELPNLARNAREAREARERAWRMLEDAEKAMVAAREEAEKAKKVAEQLLREAEASNALAEEMARIAAEEVRKVKKAKEETERRLKEGIHPIVTPSPEDVAIAKQRIQYDENCLNIAIVGMSGSGKSSLINAFRGLRSRDMGAAPVGVIEKALSQVTRYPDVNPENPVVWHDVSGAGALKCRDWQYFNDQGLYVYDCIIVLFDNRFTMTDIAILVNARRFHIPTYIVRSKSDLWIWHIMADMGYDSDDDDDVERRNTLYDAAHKQFIEETRNRVRASLEDANLPDQRVYIVSSNKLLNVVLNKKPKRTIDEVELLHDLFVRVNAQVPMRSDEMISVRV